MSKYATITLAKEYLKFSAGHFTLFSATERERLHGHNFSVKASFRAPVNENGLCFDYGAMKNCLAEVCATLDEYMLLPGRSPYLLLTEDEACIHLVFNGVKMQFLKADTRVLPLTNISVEELSAYLLSLLIKEPIIEESGVDWIEVAVSSGPGQWGSSQWQRSA